MSKIIAISCHKGGVGKTTTAAALGGILADRGKKVLLVDLDAQMNLTSTFIFEALPARTMAEALSQQRDIPEVPVRKNLFLAPSSDDLSAMDSTIGAKPGPGKDYLLAELLKPVQDKYDYVIIDSPAQVGIATANALVAADYVLIPVNADAYSIGGLGQIMYLVDEVRRYCNRSLDVLGVFITRFNPRRIVDRKVQESVATEYGSLALKTFIRENSAIAQAPICHKDITAYDSSCNGAKDYVSLCNEILKIIKKKSKA